MFVLRKAHATKCLNDQIPHFVFDDLDQSDYNASTNLSILQLGQHCFSGIEVGSVLVRSFLYGYLVQQGCCVRIRSSATYHVVQWHDFVVVCVASIIAEGLPGDISFNNAWVQTFCRFAVS